MEATSLDLGQDDRDFSMEICGEIALFPHRELFLFEMVQCREI